MTTLVLSAYLATAICAGEVVEIWEGTLATELVNQKNKKGKGQREGNQYDLTLRITRKNGKFTGEWIEGNRILEIEGTTNGGQLKFWPTRVKKGKWNNDVLKDLRFVADVKKDEMQGNLLGVGSGRARGGVFYLKRK